MNMQALVISILLFVNIFGGNILDKDLLNICDYFAMCKSITIYYDGKSQTFENGDDNFNWLLGELNSIGENSHEMPAFGVSLDNETRQALKNGVWIELNFDKEISHNEMPFEKLLINVIKDYTGINLIRYSDGEYSGRCFHLNLINDKNVNDLLQAIMDIMAPILMIVI